ncbi:MAG: TRAP transporter small permease, partial [Betaproteobacteria bacterium]
METLSRWYGKLLNGLALLACAMLLFMTLMICADVLLRNTSLVPGLRNIAWSNEVSEATLYLVTLL